MQVYKSQAFVFITNKQQVYQCEFLKGYSSKEACLSSSYFKSLETILVIYVVKISFLVHYNVYHLTYNFLRYQVLNKFNRSFKR